MCYSGQCRWEDNMGNCRFPNNKEVSDVYKYPLCGNPTCIEEDEYVNSDEYNDKCNNVFKIIKTTKLNKIRAKKIQKIQKNITERMR